MKYFQEKSGISLISIVFILAILCIVALLLWGNIEVPKSAPTTGTENATTTVTNQEENAPHIYTNQLYGWSFNYPKDWQVEENENKTGIEIVSHETVPSVRDPNQKSPLFTLSISTIKKSDFKPTDTKMGNIRFDLAQNALVDALDTPSRCLRMSDFNSKMKMVIYGGSNMSTPAYSNSAVITDKDYLILINESTYGNSETPTSETSLDVGKKMIFDSFTFPPGVSGITPDCAK